MTAMGTEQTKAAEEINIFTAFVTTAQLPYDLSTIEKRFPPEPDIVCTKLHEGPIAFELVEICDQRLAHFYSKAHKGGAYYMRTSDPTPAIIRKKTQCRYTTNSPIELLCHTSSRVITPAKIIVSSIQAYLGTCDHLFRAVWLLSSGQVYEVLPMHSTNWANKVSGETSWSS